jgi:hypothetical protein
MMMGGCNERTAENCRTSLCDQPRHNLKYHHDAKIFVSTIVSLIDCHF